VDFCEVVDKAPSLRQGCGPWWGNQAI